MNSPHACCGEVHSRISTCFTPIALDKGALVNYTSNAVNEKPEFLFHIITTSGVPIYRQLLDQINTLIATGRLSQGTFLPSIRQVGKELEINSMTVSKAYSILEREGILENVRGQGMRVVTSNLPQKDLSNRREILYPIMKQVVEGAKQLSLNKKDIQEIFDKAWKEKSYE